MIPLQKPFYGTIDGDGGHGKTYVQRCEVVGVDYRDGQYVLVTIVREGGMAFVKAAEFVDIPPPDGRA